MSPPDISSNRQVILRSPSQYQGAIRYFVAVWRNDLNVKYKWNDTGKGFPIIVTRLELFKALSAAHKKDTCGKEGLGFKLHSGRRPPTNMAAHGATVSLLTRALEIDGGRLAEAFQQEPGPGWRNPILFVLSVEAVSLISEVPKRWVGLRDVGEVMRERFQLVSNVMTESAFRLLSVSNPAPCAGLDSLRVKATDWVGRLTKATFSRVGRGIANEGEEHDYYAFVLLSLAAEGDIRAELIHEPVSKPKRFINDLGRVIGYSLRRCHAAKSKNRQNAERKSIILPRAWLESGVLSQGDGDEIRGLLSLLLEKMPAIERGQSFEAGAPVLMMVRSDNGDEPFVKVAREEFKRVLAYRKDYFDALKMRRKSTREEKTAVWFGRVRGVHGSAFDSQDRYCRPRGPRRNFSSPPDPHS